MKYNDIEEIESEIIQNDYVTTEFEETHKPTNYLSNFKQKFMDEKGNILIASVMVLTAVSLGFLIAQLTKFSSLSAISTILT